MKKICIIATLAFAVPVLLWAGTWSWSYPNYDHGSYVPKSGTFQESISLGYYTARTDFTFDSHNVDNIEDYNDGGDNPGTACDNVSAYVSLDHTADPASWDLEINATSVGTNLPNGKIDFDGGVWAEAHEAEVTAEGAVQATSYYMRSYWDDFRDGDNGDGGDMHAQFGMAKQGTFEYNDCINADGPQIINPYGNDLGDL